MGEEKPGLGDTPSHEIPYLRLREADGLLGGAVGVIGNARGLLKLRRLIALALKDRDASIEDRLFEDENGGPLEVFVGRARSLEDLGPQEVPAPKPERKGACVRCRREVQPLGIYEVGDLGAGPGSTREKLGRDVAEREVSWGKVRCIACSEEIYHAGNWGRRLH